MPVGAQLEPGVVLDGEHDAGVIKDHKAELRRPIVWLSLGLAGLIAVLTVYLPLLASQPYSVTVASR